MIRFCPLGEYVRIEHGFAFKGEFFADSGHYVLLTPGNFFDAGGFRLRPEKDRYYTGEIPQRYILGRDDLIVAMTEQAEGLLGSSALIPENNKYLHNQRLGLVKVNEGKADKRFLYYLFNTNLVRQQIRGSSSGTKVRHTSPERMYKVLVPAFRLDIQKKIASILSAYDDLIENNKRRIAILEKMAEEIYREWFVRMRFPASAQATAGKSATSTIPEGWRVARLRDVVSNYIGGGWGEDNESAAFSEGAYVIRGTDIPDVTAGKFTDIPYRFHKPSNLSSRRLEAGDFVFEVSGGSKDQLLGRNVQITEGLLQYLGRSVMCASFCKLIRFDKAQVLPEVMKYFLKLYYDQDLVSTFQVQSTGISNYQFESFLDYQTFLVPALSLQQTFNEKVLPMLRLKDNLSVATINLTKTRDLLLPRLISGKLSVENLELPSNLSASTTSSALPQAELAHA